MLGPGSREVRPGATRDQKDFYMEQSVHRIYLMNTSTEYLETYQSVGIKEMIY